MRAWHFVGDKLRDGRPVPADGEVLRHDGPIEWCQSGLYASTRIIDALEHAPGNTICRVECADIVQRDDDKLVCREHTILWRVDGTELLREFARRCALDVIHLWDAPEIVVRYLKTGDGSIQADAWDAAARGIRAARAPSAALAARTARKATRDTSASWDAARAAAWYARYTMLSKLTKQNRWLTAMVIAEHRRSI